MYIPFEGMVPMGCSHAESCPLFPKLHSSLAGWKKAYCDAEDKWMDCARYQTSLQGKPVPLALLPNGKVLGVVADEERAKTGQPAGMMAVNASAGTEGGGVAVLSDTQAAEVLEEASSATGRFFKRFKNLFGGMK